MVTTNEASKKEDETMEYGVRVCEMSTGNIIHITGKWEDEDAMRKQLTNDGYIVITSWKE